MIWAAISLSVSFLISHTAIGSGSSSPKNRNGANFISKVIPQYRKYLSDTSEAKAVYETLVLLSQDGNFSLFCFIVWKFPHLRASWTCESTQKAINNALICVHYCCLIIGRLRVCYWLPFNERLLFVGVAEENERKKNLFCKFCNC